jgi:hypothetical protein
MNSPSPKPVTVRAHSTRDLLAAVPCLLGFVPEASIVVIGSRPATGSVGIAMRYDLPDPPDTGIAAEIAGHAAGHLTDLDLHAITMVGYGPGRLVTPVADAVRAAASRAGLLVHDVLRVDEGRYWSYICESPSCCPPGGVPLDPRRTGIVAGTAGVQVMASREALAATIAPLTGPVARTMARATRRAERTAERLLARDGPRGIDQPGLAAVRHAVQTYRDGGTLRPDARHAWLALVLVSLRIRDDAWARMDQEHREAHRRLWTDVTRRARPGYIAAPASLLAFTAWQAGEGALANLALDRALEDQPSYPLAHLLREALTTSIPPSAVVLPMTPEEVAASYAHVDDDDAAQAGDAPDGG